MKRGGFSGQSQIEIAAFQHFQGMSGRLTGDGYMKMGMLADKIRKNGQKDVFAERRAYADAKLFFSEALPKLQLIFSVFQSLKGSLYMGE